MLRGRTNSDSSRVGIVVRVTWKAGAVLCTALCSQIRRAY
jgi:hypothetical protein